MIREEIKKMIEKSIKELQKKGVFPKFKIPEISVEHPEEEIHGDYASNTAMQMTKSVKKTPIEIAKILKDKFQVSGFRFQEFFEGVEVVKPGFINFFISEDYLQKQVGEILKEKEKFGELKIGKGIKTNIEFISANPTGPLHIGNGRGAFFGDSLANVLEKAGFKVVREYYINNTKESSQIKELGKTALGKGKSYLNDYLKSKIQHLKSKIRKIKDEGKAGYLLAQEIQKDNENFIGKKLKIKFDVWFSENKLYKKSKIKKIYNWLKRKNLVYKKEEAEWLRTKKFGVSKNEVIIRQSGEPTYLLSDIAYHKDKFERGFLKIIDIWGADHQGHIPKMKAGAKILGYKGDLDILITQIIRLKGGKKLSKRKGEIITLEELVKEISLDVTRFFYLTKSLNTQMEFDLDLAKEKSEKNPVYYVQYAHARICSILRKCGNFQFPISNFQINSKFQILNSKLRLLKHQSELSLIKELIRFPEIIEDTAEDYQVQRIPQYAIDLATSFHQFYRDCRVLSKDKKLTEARLNLILATKIVLKNTLGLIGISAPEKM